MQPIISMSTIIYDGYDLETVLQHISEETGGKYVEVSCVEGITEHIKPSEFGDRKFEEKFQALMEKFHLSPVGFAGNMNLSRDEALPLYEKKMEFAKKMGIKTIHAFFGPLDSLGAFCRNMKIVDTIAQSLDIVVGVENHEGIMAGEPNISALKEVSSENIGLTYDFVNAYHAANGNIDLIRDLKTVLPYIVHLHLKDTRKEGDIWHFVQVGTGIMDYRSIFKFLKSLDRQIPMTIELPVRLEMREAPVRVSRKVRPPLALDQIDTIMKNSLAYLEELWESV